MDTCTYFDVFEFKHVPLYESASYLLIGPSDEQLVIVISLRQYQYKMNQRPKTFTHSLLSQ